MARGTWSGSFTPHGPCRRSPETVEDAVSINDPHLEAMMEMEERDPSGVERAPEEFVAKQAWVLGAALGVAALGFVVYLVVH